MAYYNPYANNMYQPNMNFNVPSYNQNPMQNLPQQQLVQVNGIEGAKAYQLGINSSVALFDTKENILFVKTTDGAGYPTINKFRLSKEEELENNLEYVTKTEFDALSEKVGVIFNELNQSANPKSKSNKTSTKQSSE